MQIYLLFAERKSDALQLKILIYRPKGTVCKGFRRKDRRFSYLQGEICGGRVLRASAGEGSARTAPWRRSVAAGVAGFDRPAGRSGRIAKIADEVSAAVRSRNKSSSDTIDCMRFFCTFVTRGEDDADRLRNRGRSVSARAVVCAGILQNAKIDKTL
jgi:hypothetical protein